MKGSDLSLGLTRFWDITRYVWYTAKLAPGTKSDPFLISGLHPRSCWDSDRGRGGKDDNSDNTDLSERRSDGGNWGVHLLFPLHEVVVTKCVSRGWGAGVNSHERWAGFFRKVYWQVSGGFRLGSIFTDARLVSWAQWWEFLVCSQDRGPSCPLDQEIPHYIFLLFEPFSFSR